MAGFAQQRAACFAHSSSGAAANCSATSVITLVSNIASSCNCDAAAVPSSCVVDVAVLCSSQCAAALEFARPCLTQQEQAWASTYSGDATLCSLCCSWLLTESRRFTANDAELAQAVTTLGSDCGCSAALHPTDCVFICGETQCQGDFANAALCLASGVGPFTGSAWSQAIAGGVRSAACCTN